MKPRTNGAVFRYSTIEMRRGFKGAIPRKSFSSIAKAGAGYLSGLHSTGFDHFKSIETDALADSEFGFVIPETSARIKTLLFNLLECRKRYGNEV